MRQFEYIKSVSIGVAGDAFPGALAHGMRWRLPDRRNGFIEVNHRP